MNWATAVIDLETKGWSLTNLGRAIGLSPQAVSDIKHGRTKAPAGMAAVRLFEIAHGAGVAGLQTNGVPTASTDESVA